MYSLSRASLIRLDNAHPDLQKLVLTAITLTKIDFRVEETLRTPARQAQLVARGASQTMNSRHLAGGDGLSRAVDLVALEDDGDVSWQWPDYFLIAEAMRTASMNLKIPVEWGGHWELLHETPDLHDAQERYIARKRAEGKKPFIDGPHFQLPRDVYP